MAQPERVRVNPMHFDDRLATVLRTPAQGKVIARVQYRQLLDLLGTMPVEQRGEQVDAAYTRLGELTQGIPASERAQMLREAGLRLRNPRLVAMLAESEPPVAGAAIAGAQLTEEQWLDLVPALPVQARGILRHRRDLGAKVEARLERLGVHDRGLPPGETVAQPAETPEPEVPANDVLELDETAAEPQPDPSPEPTAIGSMVRRIEEYRSKNLTPAPVPGIGDSPRLPLGDAERPAAIERAQAFDFETDAESRIIWAEDAYAPMLVGLRLAAMGPDEPVQGSDALYARHRRRQPIDGEVIAITGAPAIEGDWRIDAAPQFDLLTGRFTGYLGKARRPAPAEECAGVAPISESDRMRQVLHELRTPANAIQMSAEVIQQQLYGPTPHEYRALAAMIAGDTALVLAGFEELDRLVRLETDALDIEEGEADLATAVTTTVSQLQAHTAPRQSGFALRLDDERIPVSVARTELDRLVWRVLAAMAGATAPSEWLDLRVSFGAGLPSLEIEMPRALASLDDDALFAARADSRPSPLGGGMFGLGFTLRLAVAEARAAGGDLERDGDILRLSLPGLTEIASNLSQS
ncbi:MAG: sensor histidine kinase [Sphingomonadaceae bacterium]